MRGQVVFVLSAVAVVAPGHWHVRAGTGADTNGSGRGGVVHDHRTLLAVPPLLAAVGPRRDGSAGVVVQARLLLRRERNTRCCRRCGNVHSSRASVAPLVERRNLFAVRESVIYHRRGRVTVVAVAAPTTTSAGRSIPGAVVVVHHCAPLGLGDALQETGYGLEPRSGSAAAAVVGVAAAVSKIARNGTGNLLRSRARRGEHHGVASGDRSVASTPPCRRLPPLDGADVL